MIEIASTDTFTSWLRKLKDRQAKIKILANIKRMTNGNLGVTRFLGEGVFEKKIDYGPGYRLYFTNDNENLILLLCGGSKSNQQTDINLAKKISKELKNEKIKTAR